MAFNLFGSIGQEDSGEKPKNTLFVLPPKNRIEEIKEKAASDAAILELNKESDNPPLTESEKKADVISEEKAAQKAEKKAKSESDTAKESKEAQAAESEDVVTQAAFSPGEIKLDKVRADFSVQFKDEEWTAKKEELEKRVMNIRIEPDINLGSVRVLLASCTNIYSELKREQRSNKTFYGVLTDKNTGLIQRQQAINAFGKNSEDRKKNSYLSCEQFKMKSGGTEYNLYDLSMIMQDRIDTINDLLDDVKQKKETLISFLAVLKLESGMVK